MLFKSKAPEKDKNAAAKTAEVTERMAPQQHSVVEQAAATPPVPKAGTSSCIGSGMSIVGNIECNGLAQICGRIRRNSPLRNAASRFLNLMRGCELPS